MSTVISVENVSKLYRLGEIGTGSLAHDLNRWWHKFRRKEDPYLKIGQTNDRTTKGESDYVYSLKDVSFQVKQGEVLGIIGRNGAGKSTLLKILSRVTTPTSGEIKVKGRIASLLEVGTGFHPELSGRDNIYLNGAILGMRKHEIARKFDEIIDFSGCGRYVDTPVKRYSSGMYVRLAFAVAAHLESEILVVDEVLAVGDAEFQAKCIGKMQDVAGYGRTVLLVSHNMKTIQSLCKHSIVLSNGAVQYAGTTVDSLKIYSGSTGIKTQVKFPEETSRPSITAIRIDQQQLDIGNLIVEIDYVSPFPLNPPIGGIVVTSMLGTPAYGSNTRFHNKGFGKPTSSQGTLKMVANSLPLHGGFYKLSAWLADWHMDYDEKKDVMAFEFMLGTPRSSTPNPEHVGFIDHEAVWQCL
jgi:lipopolysaccharide transport system ATP-binding protein